MAAKKERIGSKQRIEKCKVCQGKPIITDLNLPDFTGKKCDTCFEVIEFTKKQK